MNVVGTTSGVNGIVQTKIMWVFSFETFQNKYRRKCKKFVMSEY
jgi:hypothetical protein